MKRFHAHVNVTDLEASVGFYSTLFGSAPFHTHGEATTYSAPAAIPDAPVTSCCGSTGTKCVA
jgi:hypothetical protein